MFIEVKLKGQSLQPQEYHLNNMYSLYACQNNRNPNGSILPPTWRPAQNTMLSVGDWIWLVRVKYDTMTADSMCQRPD